MKDVKGYEDLFAITKDGKLWSKRTNRFLKQTISKTGYYTVATKIGGRGGVTKCFKIHRLVCEAYNDNPDNKPFVNHKDGNKLNNHISNLEWCTSSENNKHSYDTKLRDIKSGIDVFNSKLSREQIEEIRSLYIPYCRVFGARSLSEKYDVSHETIHRVVNNKSYI